MVAMVWRHLPLGVRRTILWRATSKFLVGVAAVCLNSQGQALLLKHRFHTADRAWGLPGGWMTRGEAPEEAVHRELREETGLQAEIIAPLLTDGDGEWIELIYLCRINSDQPHLQAEELIDWRWCDPGTVEVPMLASHRHALRLAAQRCGA